MEKLRVGIIFGGKSAEHEVSLQSTRNIVDVIDRSRSGAMLLGVDKRGQWYVSGTSNYLLNTDDPTHVVLRPSTTSLARVPDRYEHQPIDAQSGQPLSTMDVIFPIVRDILGGDGSLQGMLRAANLPFAGSDVLASTACMDKDIIKHLLRDAGLSIASFITLTCANRHNISLTEVRSKLGLPLSVKPTDQDSSVGVSKVASEEQYTIAVDLASEFDYKAIAEQGIRGRGIECAALGNDNPQASTCDEIVFTSDFYAYNTEYIGEGGAKVIAPAVIASEINDRIRTIAVQTYQTLGCAGMAHVGVFPTPENEIVINEIDTLPGFINISMYPKLWQASGLGYIDLVTRLIELALERHAAGNTLRTTI